MKIPSLDKANEFLDEAEKMNPGPWVPHSKNAALAAKLIAEKHSRMDPDIAYILGLLHDIGRREGRYHLRHTIDGYNFLMSQGFDDAARIPLTHSFPIADINAYQGEHDCDQAELNFLNSFLESVEFTEYDRLIQLCDAIALPTGLCLMEKRIVDVALRLGINDLILPKWLAHFQFKRDIEADIGCSIYQILPGIVEGTFGKELIAG